MFLFVIKKGTVLRKTLKTAPYIPKLGNSRILDLEL